MHEEQTFLDTAFANPVIELAGVGMTAIGVERPNCSADMDLFALNAYRAGTVLYNSSKCSGGLEADEQNRTFWSPQPIF